MSAASPYVVSLRDATDPAVSGQKAATLAQLMRSGEHIPPGFVVTVAGCETKNEDALMSEVEAALDKVAGPGAVRWAGCAQDGEDASLAGQYETFLNATGETAVFEPIHRGIASASRGRVSAYARDRGT